MVYPVIFDYFNIETKNAKKNVEPASPGRGGKGQGDEKMNSGGSLGSNPIQNGSNGHLDEDTIAKNRAKFFSKMSGGGKKPDKKNGG